MIDLYYWPTPNGWKVSILLEELGLEYNTIPVNIGKGDQFSDHFLNISPNAKMPAIVDHDVAGDPVTVFESGAILYYLATKTGRFIPDTKQGRHEALEWLFWQVANQGPMAGQLSHFVNYAPDGQDYGRKRYAGEYDRNVGVLERRLADREYILGDYSIADIIAFPWILIAKPLTASLDEFPNVTAWRGRIKNREAVQRGVNLMKDQQNRGQHNAQNNDVLFNQSADHFKRGKS
jgi:GST-like protein